MARIDRSPTNAHAALAASRGGFRGFAPQRPQSSTWIDVARRLPFLFAIAAPIAAALVIAAGGN